MRKMWEKERLRGLKAQWLEARMQEAEEKMKGLTGERKSEVADLTIQKHGGGSTSGRRKQGH
jgi:hypothetical protein